MQKEEFPTFLNEQPVIIFGRTGRELLIIVCGIVGGYTLWSSFGNSINSIWWQLLCLTVSVIISLGSIIFAVIYIGNRPLEEWVAAWLTYALMPKIFVYKPLEEVVRDIEEEHSEKRRPQRRQQQKSQQRRIVRDDDDDDLEED